ncbi:hypothetical protein SBA3_3270019 [Candidatus Sulfopaludibacter sp. SbA3]|nr:hypothetical protein SBA3_3270019 [Candidatus Sulfopaludibacter sp. SbA3]
MRPLDGLLVLDFSQFLAGPSAALRLADLGARVIKIERPDGGDLCRRLYISNLELEGDSTLFHSINRNKESFAADLKNEEDRTRVLALVARADVLIQNFRPGVMERLGLDYGSLRERFPGLVYAEVTGYGATGPWRDKPGQDLLVQALSGLAWLNGDAGQPPLPFGLAVADMFAGRTWCREFWPPWCGAALPGGARTWRSACWNPCWTCSSKFLLRISTTAGRLRHAAA